MSIPEHIEQLRKQLEAAQAENERLRVELQAAEGGKHESGVGPWHCAKCGKPMQFFDGICFECNGGRDPGD